MEPLTYAALGVAVPALAGVLVLALRLRALRRSTAAELTRLADELGRWRPAAPAAGSVTASSPAVAEFLITDAALDIDPLDTGQQVVDDRVVLSATLGEPLVKVVAFGHGLRRALAAESRHRIRFAVRREVRRARKQRRQEVKDAWRRMRVEDGSAA